MHLKRLVSRKTSASPQREGETSCPPVLQQLRLLFLGVDRVETMPMQRTEIPGAEELHKYYKVYETIGSGTVLSCLAFPNHPEAGLFILLNVMPFQEASLRSSWVGTF